MKRMFFVGLFLGKQEKVNFANLLNGEGRELFFLEASRRVSKSVHDNYIHLPQRLYLVNPFKALKSLFKKTPKNDAFFQLYKKDLIAFIAATPEDKPAIPRNRIGSNVISFVFYMVYLWKTSYKLAVYEKGLLLGLYFSVLNFLKLFAFSKFSVFKKSKALKLMVVRFNFILGYHYVYQLLHSLSLSKEDVFFFWGREFSSNILILELLKKIGANAKIVEYGELPGTISVNNDGIFGESDIAKSWKEFCKLSVSEKEINHSSMLLRQMDESNASSRGGSNGMFDLYQNMFNLCPDRKKVIYVNGVELIASGYIYDSKYKSNGLLNPNEYLLDSVCNNINLDDYLVMYKDHPMTAESSQNFLLDQSKFHNVVFVDELNIRTVIQLADMVISYPSKVVMTSLMMKVRTLVLGEFTIPSYVRKIGLFDYSDLSNLDSILKQNIGDDDFSAIVARMLKYKLIKYDFKLYKDLNIEEERKKLLMTLDFRDR